MNKIIKLSVIGLLLLAGVLISGCVSSTNLIAGKYVYKGDNKTYFILYDNGTYYLHHQYYSWICRGLHGPKPTDDSCTPVPYDIPDSNHSGYYVYDSNNQMLEFKNYFPDGTDYTFQQQYKSNPITFMPLSGVDFPAHYVKQEGDKI
jgi:hypothetical protein